MQTSKHSNSNFNIGNSSLSLKDKQMSLTAGKKQAIGGGLSALRQVTNDHHVQSTKTNLYQTTGSKGIKQPGNNVLKKVTTT